jgi:heat shock protein HslJ
MGSCPPVRGTLTGIYRGYLVIIKYQQATHQGMKHTSLILLVFLVIALMVAGCTSQQPPAQPVTTAGTQSPEPATTTIPASSLVPASLAGDWTLTTMGIQGGSAVTYPTTTISLILNQDGSLAGYDGCNNYFGTYTLTGTTTSKGQGMVLSGVGSSKKYCAELANQEQQYLNIFGKTNAYVVDGTQLTLTGTMGDVLIYQRPQTLVTPKSAPY